MSKLDSNFWGPGRLGGVSPGNGGQVKTNNPQPTPEGDWRPENGNLQPALGGMPGAEPHGPAAGNPVRPERGRGGV